MRQASPEARPPEPATHPNCTLGGMIGNNSCGATAQRTGKVVDNVVSLDVLLHDGTRFVARTLSDEEYAGVAGRTDRVGEIHRALRRMRDDHGDLIRERYPDIPRRVSGYNLDSLLPEHGFDLAGFLVGSEATLVTVLRAELELVPVVPARTLVVLGYPSIFEAGDHVPAILAHGPIGLEGIDAMLIDNMKRKHMHPRDRKLLPDGKGWLMVEFGGDTREEADGKARAMMQALQKEDCPPSMKLFDDRGEEAHMWKVRESGLGATARVLVDRPGKVLEVADNTPDAVASGCWQAAAALVERFVAHLSGPLGGSPQLILGGGDAQALAPLIALPSRLSRDSVLHGLSVWSDAHTPAAHSL